VRVVLHHVDGREARVRLVRERSPAEALTCADLGMSQPWRHRLVSLEVSPPPEPSTTQHERARAWGCVT
jgi:hypothetical protein